MPTPAYPDRSLREKLVVAGIPESEHTAELLARRMPADFSPDSFQGLSVDMLAELLLYLIAKGQITPQFTSDKALLDMPWGSHVCQFYQDKQDLVALLVPYFKQGLERNDACMWLVNELTVAEAAHALRAAVPNLDEYLASGQMTIRHYAEFYTTPNGRVKPAGTLRDDFAAMGKTVTENGFRGLRASADVAWVQDDESMHQFMAYETQVHCAIQDSRMMAVCTYPARAASLHGTRELIHNHGKIFVKRGTWVHDNTKDAKKIEAVFTSIASAQPERRAAQR